MRLFIKSILSCALLQNLLQVNSLMSRGGYKPNSSQAQVSSKAHKQKGGTCYAYAVATVIRSAIDRLQGYQEDEGLRQDTSLPTHQELVDRIVKKYGSDGAITEDVVKFFAPKFGLKCDVISRDEAKDAVNKLERPVVYSFSPDASQWETFESYFEHNRSGILSKRTVDEAKRRRAKIEGHSVVIVGHEKSGGQPYWKCKNSWDRNFGDRGYFRFYMDAFEDCDSEEEFIDIYSPICEPRVKYTAGNGGRGGRKGRGGSYSESEEIASDESE